MRKVAQRHPEIAAGRLFDSRANGRHRPESDVDLAVWGDVGALRVQRIAAELDELPPPFRYDAQPFTAIRHAPLREHIARVGVAVYRA
ncbi:MAG: nucleotidyltransferase domain-containing protein [Limisphaerales bacterium]